MKLTLSRIALSLFAFATLSLSALAQESEGFFEPLYVRVLMPDIKKELGITADQISKIESSFGDAIQVDGDQIMISFTPDFNMDDIDKSVAKVLTEVQNKRFLEIILQLEGMKELKRPVFAKMIGLTDDQLKQVKAIAKVYQEEFMEAMHSGMFNDDRAAGAKFMTGLKEKYNKKIEPVLTDEQKLKWKEMLGKEFKVAKPPVS